MSRKCSFIPILLLILAASSARGTEPTPGPDSGRIRVGVFLGNGASGYSGENAVEALMIDPDIEARRITSKEILAGGLAGLDVLVFPGGGGGRQVNDLGALAAAKVREFALEEGRGIVGICAGAYLLSDTPDYACLHLCGVSAVDREHDERGHGLVGFKPSQTGLEAFPELKGKDERFLYYYEGPLFVPAAGGSPFDVLGTFTSDVHLENGAPAGLMPEKPMLIRAQTGKGRVFLSACHPEATPGLRWMLPRMARWVARREAVSYGLPVVRPGSKDREILFDEGLRKEEAGLFTNILYGSTETKVKAIRRLAEIRSWDGPRWVAGCLRSGEPPIRREAAKALAEWEATWALDDVRGMLSLEKDRETRATLEFAAARLASMAPSLSNPPLLGGKRVVAVTFDDLPAVSAGGDGEAVQRAMTQKLLGTLQANHFNVVGFVNTDKLEGKDGPLPWKSDLLRSWLDAGMELGNHTYSHKVLHTSTVEEFEADLVKGEEALIPLLEAKGQKLRYFRHPCLQTGRDAATKAAVAAFLEGRGYTLAPVTFDNSEWIFASAYSKALKRGDAKTAERIREAYIPYMQAKVEYFQRQSVALFGREVSQILLLHANALNADTFGKMVTMLRDLGYSFATLDEVLKDEAYALPDGYFGGAGISWLHRWCFALGGKFLVLPAEPRCPEWVMKEAGVDGE
jgi:peptidoglycan/xylan/chitin deacetylase (PgdA/CDA1 family)/glutamine amidotransferase-like uncharacterized protein